MQWAIDNGQFAISNFQNKTSMKIKIESHIYINHNAPFANCKLPIAY